MPSTPLGAELSQWVPKRQGPAMRVVVGLSGGVDSAVAAWMLQQQGHEVLAIFMKNWEGDDDDAYCASREDFVSAASVAEVLGLELEHVNFAAEYRERVFATFLAEYQAGRTPNPDVLCNAEIKFRAFLDHAMARGAEKIATGHYARVRWQAATQQFELLRGLDPSKDQSYFLHRLTQAQLAKSLFPVGHVHKQVVRQIATAIGLPNAARKDSTGICFIGERPFREFLSGYIAKEPGPIRRADGQVLGQHHGLSFYTLGQRQGLGIGGVADAQTAEGLHQPWFVAHKDLTHNTLWVVQGHTHPWLLADELQASQWSWIGGQAPDTAIPYAAKTRYRQDDSACHFAGPTDSAAMTLRFTQPQWAVTPGQSVVLYGGDNQECCLGGGIITACNAAIDLPKIDHSQPLRKSRNRQRFRQSDSRSRC